MERMFSMDKTYLVNLCDIAHKKAQNYHEIVEGSLPEKDRLALGELAGIMECLAQASVIVEKLIKETSHE